jgi:hypothetical protein
LVAVGGLVELECSSLACDGGDVIVVIVVVWWSGWVRRSQRCVAVVGWRADVGVGGAVGVVVVSQWSLVGVRVVEWVGGVDWRRVEWVVAG